MKSKKSAAGFKDFKPKFVWFDILISFL
jgi:hypothetical protein